MSLFLRLHNLPDEAESKDVRSFFSGLKIPNGGVHIVGGPNDEALINFETRSDLLRAMMLDEHNILGKPVRLYIAKDSEDHFRGPSSIPPSRQRHDLMEEKRVVSIPGFDVETSASNLQLLSIFKTMHDPVNHQLPQASFPPDSPLLRQRGSPSPPRVSPTTMFHAYERSIDEKQRKEQDFKKDAVCGSRDEDWELYRKSTSREQSRERSRQRSRESSRTSRERSRRASRERSKRTSRERSKRTSRERSRRTSRERSRRTSRERSRRTSRERSRRSRERSRRRSSERETRDRSDYRSNDKEEREREKRQQKKYLEGNGRSTNKSEREKERKQTRYNYEDRSDERKDIESNRGKDKRLENEKNKQRRHREKSLDSDMSGQSKRRAEGDTSDEISYHKSSKNRKSKKKHTKRRRRSSDRDRSGRSTSENSDGKHSKTELKKRPAEKYKEADERMKTKEQIDKLHGGTSLPANKEKKQVSAEKEESAISPKSSLTEKEEGLCKEPASRYLPSTSVVSQTLSVKKTDHESKSKNATDKKTSEFASDGMLDVDEDESGNMDIQSPENNPPPNLYLSHYKFTVGFICSHLYLRCDLMLVTTACRSWYWLDGPNGLSSGVILVKADGCKRVAYFSFDTEQLQSAAQDELFYIAKCPIKACAAFEVLADLAMYAYNECNMYESTECNYDRPIAHDERALLYEVHVETLKLVEISTDKEKFKQDEPQTMQVDETRKTEEPIVQEQELSNVIPEQESKDPLGVTLENQSLDTTEVSKDGNKSAVESIKKHSADECSNTLQNKESTSGLQSCILTPLTTKKTSGNNKKIVQEKQSGLVHLVLYSNDEDSDSNGEKSDETPPHEQHVKPSTDQGGEQKLSEEHVIEQEKESAVNISPPVASTNQRAIADEKNQNASTTPQTESFIVQPNQEASAGLNRDSSPRIQPNESLSESMQDLHQVEYRPGTSDSNSFPNEHNNDTDNSINQCTEQLTSDTIPSTSESKEEAAFPHTEELITHKYTELVDGKSECEFSEEPMALSSSDDEDPSAADVPSLFDPNYIKDHLYLRVPLRLDSKSNYTASQIWRWLDGPEGPCTGVIIMQEGSCPKIACLAFDDVDERTAAKRKLLCKSLYTHYGNSTIKGAVAYTGQAMLFRLAESAHDNWAMSESATDGDVELEITRRKRHALHRVHINPDDIDTTSLAVQLQPKECYQEQHGLESQAIVHMVQENEVFDQKQMSYENATFYKSETIDKSYKDMDMMAHSFNNSRFDEPTQYTQPTLEEMRNLYEEEIGQGQLRMTEEDTRQQLPKDSMDSDRIYTSPQPSDVDLSYACNPSTTEMTNPIRAADIRGYTSTLPMSTGENITPRLPKPNYNPVHIDSASSTGDVEHGLPRAIDEDTYIGFTRLSENQMQHSQLPSRTNEDIRLDSDSSLIGQSSDSIGPVNFTNYSLFDPNYISNHVYIMYPLPIKASISGVWSWLEDLRYPSQAMDMCSSCLIIQPNGQSKGLLYYAFESATKAEIVRLGFLKLINSEFTQFTSSEMLLRMSKYAYDRCDFCAYRDDGLNKPLWINKEERYFLSQLYVDPVLRVAYDPLIKTACANAAKTGGRQTQTLSVSSSQSKDKFKSVKSNASNLVLTDYWNSQFHPNFIGKHIYLQYPVLMSSSLDTVCNWVNNPVIPLGICTGFVSLGTSSPDEKTIYLSFNSMARALVAKDKLGQVLNKEFIVYKSADMLEVLARCAQSNVEMVACPCDSTKEARPITPEERSFLFQLHINPMSQALYISMENEVEQTECLTPATESKKMDTSRSGFSGQPDFSTVSQPAFISQGVKRDGPRMLDSNKSGSSWHATGNQSGFKSFEGQFSPGYIHSHLYIMCPLTYNVAACQLWAMFKGPLGACTGVTIVQGDSGRLIAYLAFANETMRAFAETKLPLMDCIDIRRIKLYSSQVMLSILANHAFGNRRIFQATVDGNDKPITPMERRLLHDISCGRKADPTTYSSSTSVEITTSL